MDKEFFVEAVEANSGSMYRVACSVLGPRDECRDAMQEAVLKAWDKRHTLRDESRFKSWIIRILVNECRNIQRSTRRLIPMDQVPDSAAPPRDPTLFMALQALPEKYRLPLVLQCSEGMSYQEIAAALHLSEGAVRGRIYRAKEQLRKELEVK